MNDLFFEKIAPWLIGTLVVVAIAVLLWGVFVQIPKENALQEREVRAYEEMVKALRQ